MKLEDQVAPLELARRMGELGFPQNTIHHWWTGNYLGDHRVLAVGRPVKRCPCCGLDIDDPAYICAAPTVAEMGEWLPSTMGVETRATLKDGRRGYACGDFSSDTTLGVRFGTTEAEARAALLLMLAELPDTYRRELNVALTGPSPTDPRG